MEFFFDPLSSACKQPRGAAATGETVTLQFQISDEKFYDSAFVVLTKDGEIPVWHRAAFDAYEGGRVRFRISLSGLSCGLYFYRFAVCAGGETFFAGRGEDGRGALWSEASFALTVHEAGFSGCDWFRGTVMYHIFVDRFFRPLSARPAAQGESFGNPARKRRFHADWEETPDYLPDGAGRILNNDFFGGTLDGVTEKLGYLESLRVGVLYLSPIFEAVSNHKYDTGDYEKIDEGVGGLAAFRRLVAAAHARGMRIVLDGVFNHTGDDSRYFNRYGAYPEPGAFQSRESKYFPWYEFLSFPQKYRSWWGIETLPAVRDSEDFETFITGDGGVLDRWLSEGVDGFRLDVVDELPDRFVKKIRERLARYPGKLLIGEVWEDASEKVAYGKRRQYFLGRELDSVMNYPLRDAIVESVKRSDFHILETCVRELCDHYPKCVLDNLMNILSTHDTARLSTALMRDTKLLPRAARAEVLLSGAELEEGLRRQRCAAFLQFFLFGNPCIYYGDEIGMQGAEDPFNRGGFRWRETETSPMLAFYRRLADARTKLPELIKGEYRTEFCTQKVFVFSRAGRLFGVNESNEDVVFRGLKIPAGGQAAEGVFQS